MPRITCQTNNQPCIHHYDEVNSQICAQCISDLSQTTYFNAFLEGDLTGITPTTNDDIVARVLANIQNTRNQDARNQTWIERPIPIVAPIFEDIEVIQNPRPEYPMTNISYDIDFPPEITVAQAALAMKADIPVTIFCDVCPEASDLKSFCIIHPRQRVKICLRAFTNGCWFSGFFNFNDYCLRQNNNDDDISHDEDESYGEEY